MHRFETIDLGSYRGDDFFLTGLVDPEPAEGEGFDPDEDADSYGVVLGRVTTSPQAPNVEVVRLDTAHGQMPHLDRVYLPRDADGPRQVRLDQGYTYRRMKRFLLAHWKWFADRYRQYDQ